jgi:hypothetical protein
MNAEQASKRAMWMPTQLRNGEGRSFPSGKSEALGKTTGVVATACVEEET